MLRKTVGLPGDPGEIPPMVPEEGELEAGQLLVAHIRCSGKTGLMMSSRLTSDVKVHARDHTREDIHIIHLIFFTGLRNI